MPFRFMGHPVSIFTLINEYKEDYEFKISLINSNCSLEQRANNILPYKPVGNNLRKLLGEILLDDIISCFFRLPILKEGRNI